MPLNRKWYHAKEVRNFNAKIYLKNPSRDPQTSNKVLPTGHHVIHPHLQPHSSSAQQTHLQRQFSVL